MNAPDRLHAGTFAGIAFYVEFTRYAVNGAPALRLIERETGLPLAIASTNPGAPPPEGTVWIKSWSENTGIVPALIDADVILPGVVHGLNLKTGKLFRLSTSAQRVIDAQKES